MMRLSGLSAPGSPGVNAADAARYRAAGWWSDSTVSEAVHRNAAQWPNKTAYVDYPNTRLSWYEFDYAATTLAAQLTGLGVERGDRVAVWHGDRAVIHVLFVAIERCGAVVVGIGARAGTREVAQTLRSTQPRVLISDPERSQCANLAAAGMSPPSTVPTVVVGGESGPLCLDASAEPATATSEPQFGPDDAFFINTTFGTTGLPKCVVHTQNRWHYFHQKAVANGELTADDVFLPAIPTPFGFGIWTTHTTPIYLGATAVLLDRFTPTATWAAIARHRVTVLCCVSTQLVMLLAERSCRDYDLSSLRIVYTGGEALPCRQAAEFEQLTGSTILQFYGSNETGLLSGTTVHDSRQRRLRTAGRIVPEMSVRLFDGDKDVTETGRGQPACRGPAISLGYLGGADHDKLFTKDGRTSDFIVRGGKNISAAQVEDAVTTHSAIAVAAAVAMPDPIFGEKVCVYAELADSHAIDLSTLTEHLLAQGVSKELLPEQLIILDELPRSPGGKIAKGQLREDIRNRSPTAYRQ